MNKIVVIMSTYNGAAFVTEQLDSILSQKNVEVDVIIRDDASTDETLEKLRKYRSVHLTSKIEILNGKKYGVVGSFMYLINYINKNYSHYSYFAFADQDDYWFPNKLKIAIDSLSAFPLNEPSLYISHYQMADCNLNNLYTPPTRARINLSSALVNNIATGCTMVLNEAMLNVVFQYHPSNITMHDYWIYLLALAIDGKVYYDSQAHFLYRQHSHNVIGGKKDSFIKRWGNRFLKLFKESENYNSKMAKELLIGYGDIIPEKNKRLLQVASTPNNWRNRIKLIINPHLIGSSFDKTLRFKLLVLTGKY